MEFKTSPTRNPKDIFDDYVRKFMASKPGHILRRREIEDGYRDWELVHVETDAVVMSFSRWYNIVSVFFETAKIKIIEGQRLHMGRVGTIYPKRIERSFHNKQVNWYATNARPKVWDEERQKYLPDKLIFHVSADYCRIAWQKENKAWKVRVSRKFVPTKSSSTTSGRTDKVGFKEQFSRALKANPALKYKYVFCPYNTIKTDDGA
jgi:hypothetical protein